MKSLRTKLLVLMFVLVLFVTGALFTMSLINANRTEMEASDEIIRRIGSESEIKMDKILDEISESVDNIAYYTQKQIGSSSHILINKEMLEKHINDVKTVALSTAEHTSSCVTVYYRLSPEMTLSNYGFWYSKDKEGGGFSEVKLTNISKYDENDLEHVGWYYEPVNAGHAVWLNPYYNRNYGIEMASYVVPVYMGNTPIGVVGMDVDIVDLREAVSEIKVFDNGYAVLMDSTGNIVYHPEFEAGLKSEEFPTRFLFAKKDIDMMEKTDRVQKYQWVGEKKSLYIETLQNGMKLIITAFDKDIYKFGIKSLMNLIFVILFIIVTVPFVIFWFVNRVTAPLKEINLSVSDFFGGNLDSRSNIETDDEFGVLSRDTNRMSDMIKRYFEYFHGLSFNDELTGLNNKSAFSERIKLLNSEIEIGRSRFAVIVMDLNELKSINDNFGHERGDLLIKGVAAIMKEVYGQDCVYRTGGDDFVAILTSHVTGEIQKIIQKFRKRVEEYAEENMEIFGVKVSVSIGYSTYIKTMDSSFANVYDRADDSMRDDKHMQRSQHIV
ncbi:MAG: diguanylate cyclase [Lachnospiraceae bacterium]|nr:diguanylate cyclase [Lachnospiraceae bacterium]